MNQILYIMENKEYEYRGLLINGFLMLFVVLIVVPLLIAYCAVNLEENTLPSAIGLGVLMIAEIIFLSGFFIQQPNQSRVCTFFGKYVGTTRATGYWWMNPFVTRQKISLRIRNMDIAPIKVNDKIGNPVMIGMVLVWRVEDTYKAVFDVDAMSSGVSGTIEIGKGSSSVSLDGLDAFVSIQSDAALREVTGQFAYDNSESDTETMTLRGGGDEINELLEHKLNERLTMAGISVVEARINYLAYAPEIAAVMLRRQQASAIISAREKIVEGAVSMVKMALDHIDGEKVVNLSEEQKARMVGDLLVVLCADEPAQPVLATGSNA